MQGADTGTCAALTECACNACVCELSACEAIPQCQAIRACSTKTGCCSPVDTRCQAAGRPLCTDHAECGPLITAAQDAGTGYAQIAALSVCVYGAAPGGNCTNNTCFGSGDAGGGDSGATDSGGGG